ncbi:MAG: RagB/SusD family nutrient uptake outer membrane protein [Hymenobacter sp.]|nr:MAG: RagB/SusD family nutrient uptake outer membrane protein [Hymenobacter sp.]
MSNKFTRTLGLLTLAAGLTALSSACTKDLDQTPDYSYNTDTIYSSPTLTYQALARLYATFAISGQAGPAGAPDIAGIDEGFSNYLRQYWQMEEITTDEAVLGWPDAGLPTLNTNQWDANNEFVRATYDRLYFAIALCNDFIRQTSDANLALRGLGGNDANNIKQYREEARVLRALSYWHVVDFFGNGPFVTDADAVGVPPRYGTRAELFSYVESELKSVETNNLLLDPHTAAGYGRADKAVLWTILAKLYLNSQVYNGSDHMADVITYSSKVLDPNLTNPYSLNTTAVGNYNAYQMLFLADNSSSDAKKEIIFPITFDGQRTQGYGGMTYLLHAPIGRAAPPVESGINGGWAGLRTKPQLYNLFPGGYTSSGDSRQASFFSKGQNPNVDTVSVFSSGIIVRKYRNVTSAGVVGSDATGNFADTDFPMFRLADVKLMYAEAALRSPGTALTRGTALQQVNEVRSRSNAPALASVTLNDILAERGRELYWEGHRRTDLIRFGKYTSGYNWAFKGGAAAGKDLEATRALFPIPNTDLVVNPNLKQNPGY